MLKNVLRVIAFCLLGALAPKVEAQSADFPGLYLVTVKEGDDIWYGYLEITKDSDGGYSFTWGTVAKPEDKPGVDAKGTGTVQSGVMTMRWENTSSPWHEGTIRIDSEGNLTITENNGTKTYKGIRQVPDPGFSFIASDPVLALGFSKMAFGQ